MAIADAGERLLLLESLRDPGNLGTVLRSAAAFGVDRVILGTAAVTDEEFLIEAVKTYGDKIAVGIDIKEALYDVTCLGYKVVLAHPERYLYLKIEDIIKMKKLGIIMQVNTTSLDGGEGFKCSL